MRDEGSQRKNAYFVCATPASPEGALQTKAIPPGYHANPTRSRHEVLYLSTSSDANTVEQGGRCFRRRNDHHNHNNGDGQQLRQAVPHQHLGRKPRRRGGRQPRRLSPQDSVDGGRHPSRWVLQLCVRVSLVHSGGDDHGTILLLQAAASCPWMIAAVLQFAQSSRPTPHAYVSYSTPGTWYTSTRCLVGYTCSRLCCDADMSCAVLSYVPVWGNVQVWQRKSDPPKRPWHAKETAERSTYGWARTAYYNQQQKWCMCSSSLRAYSYPVTFAIALRTPAVISSRLALVRVLCELA